MIYVDQLSKNYDSLEALYRVSFRVSPGEVIGLLGPNGAGKTTLMKIITGFLQPDYGSVTVDGLDVLKSAREVQKITGYLPENAPLYPELSVQACLQFAADMRGLQGPARTRMISDAVRATGLTDRLTTPIGQLSKGFRQRAGLAQAILHRPKVLILDEPTNGLDPTQILEVRRLIRRMAGETTIILSTHILSEVEATCERAVIIINGRIKADAHLSQLSATSDAIVSFQNPMPDMATALGNLPGATKVQLVVEEHGRKTFRVTGSANADLCPLIFELARHESWQLTELRNERRTLESVFSALTLEEGGVAV